MTTIVWPETADSVNAIRNAIGRYIYIFVTTTGIACEICSLDPITNLSTDPFCPSCDGNYWINTVSAYEVLAHVTHMETDQPNWTVGGEILLGSTRIQMEYTSPTLSAVENAAYYMVDGMRYLEKGRSYRGVPEINRIVVTLKEQD